MLRLSRFLGALALGVLCVSTSSAQSNAVPGTDVSLGVLGGLKVWGRVGTFPNGVSGASMTTTSCNVGTQKVGWFATMNPDHPFITFIFAREENGRFEQISDRSYVKHGFFATNQSSCGQCPAPGSDGQHLLPGCSDTYDVNNNGDQYYLGPPDEVDPWLGVWTSQCSHFDKGEPPVPPPQDCDNIRSFTSQQAGALGPVGHRVNLPDAELNHPGATFWYQGAYVIKGEPEANRENNMCSRGFNATFNGTNWVLSAIAGQMSGTLLNRWSGATVTSNTNGADDGRLYVAVRVTGPVGGVYHYEYAVHNRDNARGVGALHIPIPSGANVQNLGFHDVDFDPTTDWTPSVTATEIVFQTAAHPQEWNSIFNFWFDSNAGPIAGSVALDEFLPGLGSPSVSVSTTVPGNTCPTPVAYCTSKLNSLFCSPTIAFSGIASVSAGSGFTVQASNELSSTFGLLFYGTSGRLAAPFQGGTLCVNTPNTRTHVQNSGGSPPNTDCSGAYSFDFNTYLSLGIDPSLVPGVVVDAQYWSRDTNDLAGFGTSLTDALEFTICN